MKVVILAGGYGTRLSEYTKTIPKPMVMIKNKPLIYYVMKTYAKYGYKDFILLGKGIHKIKKKAEQIACENFLTQNTF